MKRILIVEDDPMVAMINSEYLNQIKNVTVLGVTRNKVETLDFLEKNSVDLILLDIFLSGENGLDILKEIRVAGFFTDVIMITSANNVTDVKKAFSLGCIDYLIKPFDFDRFKLAINKFLHKESILKNEKIVQSSLDKINLTATKDSKELPKGLNKITLDKVLMCINSLENKEFNIKELSSLTEITNVTLKKYLDYLEEINVIKVRIIYGNIGRPQFIYIKGEE